MYVSRFFLASVSILFIFKHLSLTYHTCILKGRYVCLNLTAEVPVNVHVHNVHLKLKCTHRDLASSWLSF